MPHISGYSLLEEVYYAPISVVREELNTKTAIEKDLTVNYRDAPGTFRQQAVNECLNESQTLTEKSMKMNLFQEKRAHDFAHKY